MRGKDYQILKRAEVQARLKLPPDQHLAHPESGVLRALYDCPDLPLGPESMRCRLVVATHPTGATKSRIGVTRSGVVYELFVNRLPQSAFTASDVVALYLHRGAFENALADEDQEQDPDRWVSQTAPGQECWQIVSQWLWNLRLELGHQLHPDPVRTTEFAPALPSAHKESPAQAPVQGYGLAEVALPGKAGRFSRQTLPSNQMGLCVVQQANHWWHTSGAGKPMAACAWSMRPASGVAVLVLCASSVSGMAVPPPSRVG